jgi:hypothetical protein
MKRLSSLLLSLAGGFQLLNPQIQESPKPQIIQNRDKTQIESKIKKDYGLDTLKINFEIFPKDTSFTVLGIYSSWCDSLKLNYYRIMQICQRTYSNSDSLLTRTMRHELAHYHTDKMQEKLGLKQINEEKHSMDLIQVYTGLLKISEKQKGFSEVLLQNFVNTKREDLTNLLIDRIINEGIATCYENLGAKPILTRWPTSINDIKNSDEYNMYIYGAGWNLMYPIISAHGNKGIEYVLKNMPKSSDFSNLEAYQKTILEKLTEPSKSLE